MDVVYLTGEKNRFKTSEKLWNLDDKQLKTPVHDAMVLWLMDEDNLKALLYKYCDFEKGLRNEYVGNEVQFEIGQCMDTLVECNSEVPLHSSPTFIGGYADLIVSFSFIKPILHEICPIEQKWCDEIESIECFEDMADLLKVYHNDDSFDAKQYCESNRYLSRYYGKNNMEEVERWELRGKQISSDEIITRTEYVDTFYDKKYCKFKDFFNNINLDCSSVNEGMDWMYLRNKYTMEDTGCHCLIEVKPYIDSFGAVLRQIKSYMSFYRSEIHGYNRHVRIKKKKHRYKQREDLYCSTQFCLFTFDDRFDKQFESQGVKVLHPWTSKEDMLERYGLK